MHRRSAILELLAREDRPVTGSELAERFGVSRQVIVQDIALLRAQGHEIIATPQGYRCLRPDRPAHRDVFAVHHPPERTAQELYLLVDHGLRVLDVIVEHPLYGELRGDLMLESREDVRRFLAAVQQRQVTLLSTLTGGFHLHTVEASRPDRIDRARQALAREGILIERQGE